MELSRVKNIFKTRVGSCIKTCYGKSKIKSCSKPGSAAKAFTWGNGCMYCLFHIKTFAFLSHGTYYLEWFCLYLFTGKLVFDFIITSISFKKKSGN